MERKISVLFVCLGNICRSPTADAIGKFIRDKYPIIGHIDSAGTSAYHIGEPPHKIMTSVANEKGVMDMSSLRARQVAKQDFYEFDYVVAMDESNYQDLIDFAPGDHSTQIVRLLDYTHYDDKDVPDPYYGGHQGFRDCYTIVENGVKGFFHFLQHRELQYPQ